MVRGTRPSDRIDQEEHNPPSIISNFYVDVPQCTERQTPDMTASDIQQTHAFTLTLMVICIASLVKSNQGFSAVAGESLQANHQKFSSDGLCDARSITGLELWLTMCFIRSQGINSRHGDGLLRHLHGALRHNSLFDALEERPPTSVQDEGGACRHLMCKAD